MIDKQESKYSQAKEHANLFRTDAHFLRTQKAKVKDSTHSNCEQSDHNPLHSNSKQSVTLKTVNNPFTIALSFLQLCFEKHVHLLLLLLLTFLVFILLSLRVKFLRTHGTESRFVTNSRSPSPPPPSLPPTYEPLRAAFTLRMREAKYVCYI